MQRLIASSVLVLVVGLIGCEQSATTHPGAIPVPEPIASNTSAQEIASIWADGEHQTVLLADREGWTNGHWGLMAADFIRHTAKARAARTGEDEETTLAEIKRAFDAEWEEPTDKVTGEIR